MNLIFHSEGFASRSQYGLARYARELWAALSSRDPSLHVTPYALRGDTKTTMLNNISIPINRPRMDSKFLAALWALNIGPRLEASLPEADLVHTVELDYPVSTRLPWIVTVHDLGPLTHPQYFSQSKPWIRKMGLMRAVNKADIIVAVSGATAEAIEHVARKPLGDRLKIVHEGVGEEFFTHEDPACLVGLDIPPDNTPFLLWTGSLNPRKNLENVLEGFEIAAPQIPHHLVLAGGMGWDHEGLLGNIERSNYRARIHRPGYVSDAQLRALYHKADCFIYVSLMEGFGLPILEAMAGGCPVITSNLSSMPEVAGNAGVLVDPGSSKEIAQAIMNLAHNASLRSEKSEMGKKWAREFSWNKCADTMCTLYRSV